MSENANIPIMPYLKNGSNMHIPCYFAVTHRVAYALLTSIIHHYELSYHLTLSYLIH